MRIPKKPFANYKWRWAVVTPTESLNEPPIFLGILRVLEKNEYKNFSSEEVNNALKIVQKETDSSVNLVRSPERNIFRNSQQYWKGLGLLAPGKRGQIVLSPFGKKLANGLINQIEFAATIVQTFELPNKKIEKESQEWDKIGLKIKPFKIILSILSLLTQRYGLDSGYITPDELTKIVIPLAGDKGLIQEYVDAIIAFREEKLNIENWPNCITKPNDKRMAREFLIFLSNYGFCNTVFTGKNKEEKYFLADISIEEIEELYSIDTSETELERIERIIQSSKIPASIERKRVIREVINRPNQTLFRKSVLKAYKSKCIITGVNLETVLEAAHIKPVKYKGTDQILNGICMRADIHTLFDANHLKIFPNGILVLSEEARRKENYFSLPKVINIPNFVDRKYLDWRIKYY